MYRLPAADRQPVFAPFFAVAENPHCILRAVRV